MTPIVFEVVGTFAYPHAPLSVCQGNRLGVKLLSGGDGEATLGTLTVPLKSGTAIFDLSRLAHGVHPLRFRTEGKVLCADAVRVDTEGARLLIDEKTEAACARIELARQREAVRALTDAISRLENAVFRTTIF